MPKPVISIIVAMAENRVIGNKNGIPWHIKEDLLRFKNLTLGKTTIVGRTTYDLLKNAYASRGKPMPDRRNVIITNNPAYKVDEANCYIVHSIAEAIKEAKEIEPEEIFIAGGASIFNQSLDYADRLFLTVVHKEIAGDAFFPEYEKWFKTIVSRIDSHDENFYYTFWELTP